MRAGVEMTVSQGIWENAARGYGNLSELQLTLGRIPEAIADAQRSVDHADYGGDAAQAIVMHTVLADALHQAGRGQGSRDSLRGG